MKNIIFALLMGVSAISGYAQTDTLLVKIDTMVNNWTVHTIKVFGCMSTYNKVLMFVDSSAVDSVHNMGYWVITRPSTKFIHSDKLHVGEENDGIIYYVPNIHPTIEIRFDLSPPNTPPGWHDTTLCGNMIAYTLDAGSGWSNSKYTWNDTIHHEQSWTCMVPGTYWVEIKNQCNISRDTITISIDTTHRPHIVVYNVVGDTTWMTATNLANIAEWMWIKLDSMLLISYMPYCKVWRSGDYVVVTKDFDGCMNIDTITIVVNVITGIQPIPKNVFLFPNPTDGIVNIESGNIEVSNFQVPDITGRTIISGTGKTVNMAKCRAGMYTIKIITKENSIYFSKVMRK